MIEESARGLASRDINAKSPSLSLILRSAMNAIKRLKKERSADRSRYSEDRDCCRLGGALDSFDYGRFDRRGEAVQIRRDSSHAEGLAGSQGPSPEPPRFDYNRAMMPRVAPSFHAENTQNVFIEGLFGFELQGVSRDSQISSRTTE